MADASRPKTPEEYARLLLEKGGRHVSLHRRHYDSVTATLERDLRASRFWSELTGQLSVFDASYRAQMHYPLLAGSAGPVLHVKSFDSFFNKVFRRNVVHNPNWPDPPSDGWIAPHNWYARIHDILRTIIVVKYLDGVRFLISEFERTCSGQGLKTESQLEARPEGYYAAHFYARNEFEISKLDWDTERVSVSVEIQVTTQLQEVIKNLLHTYYEKRRLAAQDAPADWQWDYRTDECCTNDLGHILHYVEGMIVEIRERQERQR